jgi:predicted nuclease with TOPRIM domain
MSKYFYGNEVSAYGQENNRVDYRTFAKAFNHVLANGLMEALEADGHYFEMISGWVDNSEEIEEIENRINELNEIEELTDEQREELEKLESELDELNDEQERIPEIFQFYVVDNDTLLQENNEIVFYCEDLDLYIWGVTHFGSGWDYVLTDIELS